jgi:hypothetical protein
VEEKDDEERVVNFRNYRKTEATAFIESEFQITTLSFIPQSLESKVKELLLDAANKIVSNVEAGNLLLNVLVDFPGTEEKLRLFFVRIFSDINSYSLPELHPDFELKSDAVSKSVAEEAQEDLLLSNSQVAKILTAMKKMPGSPSILDFRALDDFIDGEDWANTHARKHGGNHEKKKSRLGGMWTEAETDALEKGMEMFGNDWKTIRDHFSKTLERRSNVNLKDRARNVKRRRIKEGIPLGIWHLACG